MSPNIYEPLMFYAATSEDATGDIHGIVDWEWDWDNDGVLDDTGSVPWHDLTTPGTHRVQLRVTDGGGDTPTLLVPLAYTVPSGDFAVEFPDWSCRAIRSTRTRSTSASRRWRGGESACTMNSLRRLAT